MNITEQIEEKIDYLKFYSEYCDEIKQVDENQYVSLCPMHTDTQPSFGFNTKTGLWNCYAGCGSGNIFTFLQQHLNIDTKQERIQWLCKYLGIKYDGSILQGIIDDAIWQEYHEKLINNHGLLLALNDKRGITIDTVKKFKLGQYNAKITIPIFDEKGKCVNIRYYAFGKTDITHKMLNHKDDTDFSYGQMRLYPIANILQYQKLIMFEGEMDTILANQLGIPGITVTSGAGSFRDEWAPKFFKGKTIYICYDIDQAGKAGAIRVAKKIHRFAEKVYIVDLKQAITQPANADFTDYIINSNYTVADFRVLIKDSKEYIEVENQSKRIRNKEYKKVALSQSSHAANALVNIEVKALVSGKDYPPFEIPDKIRIECDGAMGEKICPFCPMFECEKNTKEIYLSDEIEKGSLLNLIDVSDIALFANIRKQIGIPANCNHWKSDIKTYVNIEELRLIPEIDFSNDENYEYVQHIVYYAGHGIRANIVYTFKGLALPNPKTQQATALFYEAEPAIDSIDMFKVDENALKKLEKFKIDINCIEDYLAKRYNDIEIASGIFERQDIATAYDIVLHSPLNFKFQGKQERGWMEMLLIGDSGCGKTELAKAMINLYKVGEFVTGESSTVAGLIGGLSQTAKKWHINWGKIPLNNRRAIFIDEISGMSIEDIALFSGVRSSGIAELTKIRTEKTFAQTRKIWIGNPRKMGQSSRAMMEYAYGVVAVKELIGNLEDIRRFDFVMSAHSGEVHPDVYNQKKKEKKESIFTSDDYHTLILWIWSRKVDEIKFTTKATNLILKLASEMGQKYFHGIPIVESADQRLKLARGAAAIAGLTYSTTDGQNLIVELEHVQFFTDWIEKIYNKESMRYGEWSRKESAKKKLKNQSAVDRVITNELVETFQDNNLEFVNLSSLMDFTGLERSEAKVILSTLLKNNALQRIGTSYYRKTEAFINYLNGRLWGDIVVDESIHQQNPEDDQPF